MNTGRYTISTLIVVAAMVIVLPLLAYLQYLWLGQVSEQELDRMRRNLQISGSQFSMDFNREMTELVKSVGEPLSESDEQIRGELTRRIDEWKRNTAYPGLVQRIDIGPLPSVNDTVSVPYTENSSLVICKDSFTVAIPILDRPQLFGLVQLDRSYTVHRYLPELVQTHFAVHGKNDFIIVIVERSGRIWFASDSTTAQSMNHPDIIEPFWSLPPVPLGRMPRPIPGSPQAVRPPVYKAPSGQDFPGFLDSRRNLKPNRPWDGNRFWGTPARRHSLFELRIAHRAGSLEAAVTETRNRNFAIGFGVLLLLGSSMIFLLLSSNRERSLARQQLEFVTAISHELRTPLAVLKSVGENLADGLIPDTGRVKQYGSVIEDQVHRLSNMVEKTLAYAAIHSGKRKYEYQVVDVTSVIAETLRNAKCLGATLDIAFDVAVPNDLPMVVADEDALRTALENIVNNAIKYCGNERWVGVRADAVIRNNRPSIEIVVQDRGIGIPNIDKQQVFQSFYRAKNAVDGQIPGSGLGLAITRHIIEAHRGTITFESRVNVGSTFTIMLPAFRGDGDRA